MPAGSVHRMTSAFAISGTSGRHNKAFTEEESAGCFVTWVLATICATLGFAWWVAIVFVVMTIPALTWTAHKRWTYAS